MLHDAVLTDTHLIRCDMPDHPIALTPISEPTLLEELEHLIGVYGLFKIWLHPSCRYAQPATLSALFHEAVTIRDVRGESAMFIDCDDQDDPDLHQTYALWPRFNGGDGRKYVIIFPSARWRFYTMDAPAMVRAIGAITSALKIPHLAATPAATGLALMESALRAHKWDQALQHECAPDEHARYAVADLYWKRPIREPGRNVYGYDVNSAYLACAANGDFGIAAPTSTATFQRGMPGFYRVTATPAGSSWDGRDLPAPFTNAVQDVVTGWHAEPLVRFALDHGWAVTIHEGCYWPKEAKHRMLPEWSAQLWAARNATQGLERTVVKDIMRSAIGRLQHIRPDWRTLIIAECRARRLRFIDKLLPQGYAPFAVHTDALYFVGDAPIPIPISDGLGAYKDAGCYPVTDALRAGAGDLNVMLQAMKHQDQEGHTNG